MKQYEAIDVIKASGNAKQVTEEKRISGKLDFVPLDDRAWLMLPVSVLIAHNDEARKRNVMEVSPLSKMDIWLRGVIELTKAEASKVLALKIDEEVVIVRKGWGRIWQNKIRCSN